MKITHKAFCLACRLQHRIRARSADHLFAAYSDWCEKHQHKNGCLPGLRSLGKDGIEAFGDNSDIKQALQSTQTLTFTSLQSLASSATAGACGTFVDNSTNLYSDASIMVHIVAVNTAPASDKNIYVFGFGSHDGSIFTSTGTSGGTVGTDNALTFPSVSTLPIVMPLIGTIPYPVQNKAIDAGPFYMSSGFRKLPPYWGVAILNFSGMALAASANTVTYRGMYDTVI